MHEIEEVAFRIIALAENAKLIQGEDHDDMFEEITLKNKQGEPFTGVVCRLHNPTYMPIKAFRQECVPYNHSIFALRNLFESVAKFRFAKKNGLPEHVLLQYKAKIAKEIDDSLDKVAEDLKESFIKRETAPLKLVHSL